MLVRFKVKGKGNKLFNTCLNIDNKGNLKNNKQAIIDKVKSFDDLKGFDTHLVKLFDFSDLDSSDTFNKF